MPITTVYGIHAVQAAIQNDAGNILQIWADSQKPSKRLDDLLMLARTKGLTIKNAEGKQLDKLAKTRKHQNVVAEYSAAATYAENDLFDILTGLDEVPLVLVLDGVTDPHNLGACLRTSEAAGVHAVIIPRDKSVGLTPAVRKVASGAAELVPLVQVTNLARTLEGLKDAGLWIIGASDKAGHDIYEQDLTMPLALVMGAEGPGMRKLTEKHCDLLVSLPMMGKISSLNISVAAGICLYETVRQRRYESR